jgi:hypothetical protein
MTSGDLPGDFYSHAYHHAPDRELIEE